MVMPSFLGKEKEKNMYICEKKGQIQVIFIMQNNLLLQEGQI